MRIKHLFAALLAFVFFAPAAFTARPAHAGVQLQIRVYLQGALLGVHGPDALMRDALREQGLLPSTEPYTALSNFRQVGNDGGNEAIVSPAVFETTGPDAIVDWVFVELRNPADPAVVEATRTALLQRDGDLVDVDGVSPLKFQTVEPGEYHVAVRHRNHLGIMSAAPFQLSEAPQNLDFTNPDFATYGMNARVLLGDRMAMWGGDVNHDGGCVYQGPDNDAMKLFTRVLYDSDNINFDLNFISTGYAETDVNLDGKTVYQGPKEDRGMLFFILVSYWQNYCPNGTHCGLVEQLP
ncbi:MAG: hypothetical protein HY842_03340 [Bacteroidetes bacterium]|nr:hypothetical protein [Bacteroidota bacterium]